MSCGNLLFAFAKTKVQISYLETILNDFSNAYSKYFIIKKDVMMKLFKFDL